MILKFIGTIFLLLNYLTGNDYLNPNFDLIIDDIIECIQKQKLSDYIGKWIQDKIN